MVPNFVRSTIRDMAGYTPGEQPGMGQRIIKLNTNENPFPPSPKVLAAIKGVEGEMLRRYPNPSAEHFRATAAKVLGVEPEMIIACNGSDDTLSIAMRTFLAPGETVVCPQPTYSLYPVLAQIGEVKHVGVPWEKDWDLPIEAMLAAKPRAIFFANPNAPSGTFVSAAKVKQLLKWFDGLVLVDEAYADFADGNCLALVREHENLVVSRTLSKAYSLAGLRFGFAIAQPQVIHEMTKVKDSYNCDAIAIVAAAAALDDQEYARRGWEHVRGERQRLTRELTGMGWSVLPSQTNFVLASVPGGNGKGMYLGLKEQGILVRYFDMPGLQDKVRITIGTSQENNALLAVIKNLLAAGKAA